MTHPTYLAPLKLHHLHFADPSEQAKPCFGAPAQTFQGSDAPTLYEAQRNNCMALGRGHLLVQRAAPNKKTIQPELPNTLPT